MATQNQNTGANANATPTEEQILNDLKNNGKGGDTSKRVEPTIETLEGVITKVTGVIERNGSEFVIVKIGEEEAIVSKALLIANATELQVGNSVVATCEKRVPGKTGYLDQDGKWQLHKGKGGLALNKVSMSQDKALQEAELRDKVREKDLMNASSVQSAERLMDLMSKRLGDNPQALATAFAGAFTAIK